MKPSIQMILILCGIFLAGCAAASPEMTKVPSAVPENKGPDGPVRTFTAPSILPAVSTPAVQVSVPGDGVGILGDSFYDEYQADDHRGGSSHATTFNLVEILARTHKLNFGNWGIWGEPRRTGYEYNWARSGATSSDLIQQGQHTGLAAQIRQGKVSYVFIGIGANDFSPYYGPYYQDIYSGKMSDAQLTSKIATAVANVTLAVQTVQQAGAKNIVVTCFSQWELDPSIGEKFPDAARRQRITKAIDLVNQGIAAMARANGVVVFDQNALGKKLLPALENGRYFKMGSERIDFLVFGDDPHHSRLADQQHIGTLLSGVLANAYFVDTFNSHFGTHIQRLSDGEILKMAGIQ